MSGGRICGSVGARTDACAAMHRHAPKASACRQLFVLELAVCGVLIAGPTQCTKARLRTIRRSDVYTHVRFQASTPRA